MSELMTDKRLEQICTELERLTYERDGKVRILALHILADELVRAVKQFKAERDHLKEGSKP